MLSLWRVRWEDGTETWAVADVKIRQDPKDLAVDLELLFDEIGQITATSVVERIPWNAKSPVLLTRSIPDEGIRIDDGELVRDGHFDAQRIDVSALK